MICLSFVTEISTFATFAGLLTAGLAVAMQSVLVSVVGYFFLIGKYGIRVGDRIQIGTVVGEVLDIGLVALHLRELNQQGPLGSTGRVVAFANLGRRSRPPAGCSSSSRRPISPGMRRRCRCPVSATTRR